MTKHIRLGLPGIIAITWVLFTALFAFDTPLFTIGFLIHLLPNITVIAVILIFNKQPKLLAKIFFGLFILSLIFFHTYNDFVSFLIVSLPMLIISGLYWKTPSHKPLKSAKKR